MKAIIALTVLLTASIATAAEPTRRVTVNGQDWDIDVVSGTYAQHADTLTKQPWFGHKTLAREFLIAYMGFETGVPVAYYGGRYFPNLGGNHSNYFTFYDVVSEKGNLVGASYYAVNVPGDGCVLDGPEWHEYYTCQLGARELPERECNGEISPGEVCHFAVATPANQPFGILPVSGSYAASNRFDIVVTGITASIDHITSVYDGQNISDVLAGCWVQKTDTSISCNDISWADLGPGQHTFEVYLDLSNGEQHYESVTWTVY
jgi:hypothetical protein